jgi:hypothetical protein
MSTAPEKPLLRAARTKPATRRQITPQFLIALGLRKDKIQLTPCGRMAAGLTAEVFMIALRLLGLAVLGALILVAGVFGLLIFGHILIIALILVTSIFWVVMLVAALANEPTVLEKLLWFLVIFCMPFLGALIYYFLRYRERRFA